MRTLSSLLAALLCAAPAMTSAQSALLPSDREGYYVTPVEMLEVVGVYRLSDGRILRITREGRRVWADLTGVGRIPLTPVDSIAFVSPDRRMRFEFRPMAFATDVVITSAAGQQATTLPG
jgi:hypothetical protein